MNQRRIISGVILVLICAYYLFKDKTSDNNVTSSEVFIEGFNYLPTSTTNYVVHHDYYSLSYAENHEQAEWVSYELKRNHLASTKFKRPYFQIDKSI